VTRFWPYALVEDRRAAFLWINTDGARLEWKKAIKHRLGVLGFLHRLRHKVLIRRGEENEWNVRLRTSNLASRPNPL
jgi:hypothetical protein